MADLALKIQVDANGNVTGFFNQATGEVGKFAGGVNQAKDAIDSLGQAAKNTGDTSEKAFIKTTAGLQSISE
jgi:hypothetical protein